MGEEELRALVAEGEHARLEFKESLIAPPYIAKAVSALSNHDGGYLLIGVNDLQEIPGIAQPIVQTRLLDNIICEWLQPVPAYETGIVPLWETGLAVIWVRLFANPAYMVQAWHEEGHWRTYLRTGDRSLPCGKFQKRLLEQGVRPVYAGEQQLQWPKSEQKIWKQLYRLGNATPREVGQKANISERRARFVLDRWAKSGLLIVDETAELTYVLPNYISSRKRS